jgi:hypothetical protein
MVGDPAPGETVEKGIMKVLNQVFPPSPRRFDPELVCKNDGRDLSGK